MQKTKLQFKVQNYLLITVAIFTLLLSAAPVFAADIFFNAKNQSFTQGEEFLVQVFLNTEGESVNAIEGRVMFPVDLLETREIRDGNSSINFWIEKPHILQTDTIAFSGITPGGFSGPKEHLFSIVFYAKKSGSGAIEIHDTRALRNDGEGTTVSIKISPLQLSISQKTSAVQPIVEPMGDTDSPETFTPEIVQNPGMFDGQWFLVFATQDKGSGIDRYEVCEGSKTTCVIAESPYVLQNQNLDQKIFVKAIDRNGNERISSSYYPVDGIGLR